MEKPDSKEWEMVRVRSTTLRTLREYSELSLAPVAALVGQAVEFWIKEKLPNLMKPFEGKKK